MTTISGITQEIEKRMKKTIESFGHALAKLRTSRAHPDILKSVLVMSYGNLTPIHQVANIVVEDAQTLAITPWEKGMAAEIDKAIRAAGLGLNPTVTGLLVRVPLPPLTEERRKELIRQAKGEGEEAKVALRAIRRDGNTQVKELHKKKMVSEDEVRRAEDAVQKLTDKMVVEIDKLLAQKEKELSHI
jgi:ribosome recycling factor